MAGTDHQFRPCLFDRLNVTHLPGHVFNYCVGTNPELCSRVDPLSPKQGSVSLHLIDRGVRTTETDNVHCTRLARAHLLERAVDLVPTYGYTLGWSATVKGILQSPGLGVMPTMW